MNDVSLPRLIRVPEWAKTAGLGRVQAYDAVKRMPLGVRVTLGNRVRLDVDRLAAWLAAGGNLSDRAS